jgi:hypothetical protein
LRKLSNDRNKLGRVCLPILIAKKGHNAPESPHSGGWLRQYISEVFSNLSADTIKSIVSTLNNFLQHQKGPNGCNFIVDGKYPRCIKDISARFCS